MRPVAAPNQPVRISGNQSPGQRILDDAKLSPYLLPEYITQLKKNINHGQPHNCMFAMGAIPPLSAAHAPILAGTDEHNPGTAPGASLHGELEYLVEAGLTPLQALVAATSASASAFHLTDRGRILPGLRADLLLVNGEPTANIKATRDILVHNRGMANAIYVSKSGGSARYTYGERLEIPGPYFLASWKLLAKVIRDLTDAIAKKV